MTQITLLCTQIPSDSLTIQPSRLHEYEGQLCFSNTVDSDTTTVCISAESEERLYQFLSQRRGITPPAEPEPNALTRIALEALAPIANALEALIPIADALTKLASYATDESAPVPIDIKLTGDGR